MEGGLTLEDWDVSRDCGRDRCRRGNKLSDLHDGCLHTLITKGGMSKSEDEKNE